MSRYGIFVDISGQLSDAAYFPRVTVTAIAIDMSRVSAVRSSLPANLPKWSACSLSDAERVVSCINSEALSVAALSLNRSTAEWSKFVNDSKLFQAALTKQDRKSAGFVRPANAAKYFLFSWAVGMATAHAIKLGHRTRLLTWQGAEAIYRTVVCDAEIQGDEAISLFRGLWMNQAPQPKIASMGFTIITEDIKLQTEQEEPLLMLPDYFAGLVQCSLTSEPGRIRFPLSRKDAYRLVATVDMTGKSEIQEGPFNLDLNKMFGISPEMLAQARVGWVSFTNPAPTEPTVTLGFASLQPSLQCRFATPPDAAPLPSPCRPMQCSPRRAG